MRYYFIILLLNLSNLVYSQTESLSNIIYSSEVLNVLPDFPGGKEKLINYLQKHLKVPKKSKQNDVKGRVYVQFVIEKNGQITNIKILRSLNNECDNEVIKTISKMPKWSPGEKNNEIVRSYYLLPVNFKPKNE